MRKNLSLVFLLAFAASGLAWAHQPPEDLHRVGDHWTAWDPPLTFPDDAELYVIRSGDTLWDLAGRFYGNPYLWPQLWERNRYILDAHWIYPGDPLVVGIDVTPIGEIAASTDAAEAEGFGEGGIGDGAGGEGVGGQLNLDRSISPPVPIGHESDIQCSGFIGDDDETFGYRIASSEYGALMPDLTGAGRLGLEGAYGSIDSLKVDLSTGDIVYIDSGIGDGLLPGRLYTVIQPRERVFLPGVRRASIGRFYRYSGRVRILSAQDDTSIAEVVQSCMPINVGDGLRPYVPEAVPLVSRGQQVGINDPVSESVLSGAPMIIRSESRVFSIGQDHVVYVDRGVDEVEPGQLFTVYRLNKKGLPPVVIGEIGILTVHERSAVAKVLESRHTIYVGDLLAPKR